MLPLKKALRGSIMLLVIIFGGIFFTMLIALSSFIIAQNHIQDITRGGAEALNIAEAGINYYRWFLTHYPGNATNGTGQSGPYVTAYADPEGGTAGQYSLSVTGNTACGVVQSINVSSTGVPNDMPSVSSTIVAHYAAPSVAAYSMIIGNSTWFDGTTFYGPMHSNGGLRMDNTSNNAQITSSISSWSCDSSFGCTPTATKPGIFGTGANQNLWQYPVPQTDFVAINSDFSSRKALAQASGIYLPRYSTSSNPHLGYHLIFNANGTVTVKRVTSAPAIKNTTLLETNSSGTDYSYIGADSAYQTLPIPPLCSLIFVEDNVWIEGVIPSKITIIAANVTNAGIYPNIVLKNNITYSAFDGSDGLTAIASHSILIAPDSPQNLTLDGIFVAQSGAFGRHAYCGTAYRQRGQLTMLGTIVSALRQNNYWINFCSGGASGYPDSTWTLSFDRPNSTNPPPFTPNTSATWQITTWQQK